MKKLLTNAVLPVFLSSLFRLQAGNVVIDWNTIASTTIVKNGGKASTPSGVCFAYTTP